MKGLQEKLLGLRFYWRRELDELDELDQQLFSSVQDQVAERYRFSETHALILSSPAASAAAVVSTPVVDDHPTAVVRNVRFLEALLQGSTENEEHPVLILAPRERVAWLLDELRQNFPSKMVGEAGWIDTALDYIVASPDLVAGFCHGAYICAVIVDGGSVEFPGATEAMSRIESFSGFSAWQVPGQAFDEDGLALVPFSGLRVAPPFLSISERLLQHLPEASDCPGLGDVFFRDLVHVSARRKPKSSGTSIPNIKHDSSVSVADWSAILALLPGLVRASAFQGRTVLVVAPANRVARTVELVKVFAKQLLGLSNTRFLVTPSDLILSKHQQQQQGELLVCSLDLDTETSYKIDRLLVHCARVVFLEVDALLQSGRKAEMEWIISAASSAAFTFHYTSLSGRETWSSSIQPAHVKEFISAEATLTDVRLFTCELDCGVSKVEKLRGLVRDMQLGSGVSVMVMVMCNSGETAMKVAEELIDLGVNAMLLGREKTEVSSRNRPGVSVPCDTPAGCKDAARMSRGLVLVSEFEERESLAAADMVIMYEMPGGMSGDEQRRYYVRRCGGARSSCKHVLNLVSGEEDMVFLRGLGKELVPLPTKATPLDKLRNICFRFR